MAPLPTTAAAPAAGGGRAGGVEVFGSATLQRDLLTTCCRWSSATFRVTRNPDERAIMGLSMGGAQSLKIGFDNLDTFHTVVGFELRVDRGRPRSVCQRAGQSRRRQSEAEASLSDDRRADGLIAGNQRSRRSFTTAGYSPHFRPRKAATGSAYGGEICTRSRPCSLVDRGCRHFRVPPGRGGSLVLSHPGPYGARIVGYEFPIGCERSALDSRFPRE